MVCAAEAYGGQRGRGPVEQPGLVRVRVAVDLLLIGEGRTHVVQRAVGTVEIRVGVFADHASQLAVRTRGEEHFASQNADLWVQLHDLHRTFGGVAARQKHHVLPLIHCVRVGLRRVHCG